MVAPPEKHTSLLSFFLFETTLGEMTGRREREEERERFYGREGKRRRRGVEETQQQENDAIQRLRGEKHWLSDALRERERGRGMGRDEFLGGS